MNGTSGLEAVLRLGEGGLTATQKRETASHGTKMLVFVFSIITINVPAVFMAHLTFKNI